MMFKRIQVVVAIILAESVVILEQILWKVSAACNAVAPLAPLVGGLILGARPKFVRATQMVLSSRAVVLVLLLGTIVPLNAYAQDPDNSVAIGVPKFSTVTGGPDVINLGNLNVHWEFPIINKPGRGLPFELALTFDNSVWKNSGAGGTWFGTRTLGWAVQTAVPNGSLRVIQTQELCGGTGFNKLYIQDYSNYVYTDSSNISHAFSGAKYELNQCTHQVTSSGAAASDGSGYVLLPQNLGGTIGTISGVSMFAGPGGVVRITDPNGNVLQGIGSVTPGTTTTWMDVLRMTVVTETLGDHSAGSQDTYAYTDSNGAQQTVTVKYSGYTLQTNFGCPNISDGPPTSSSLVSSIVYPDGRTYSFTYEPTPGNSASVTGRLGSVTLPTGEVIKYSYPGPNDGMNCAMTDSSTIGLTRQTPDGATTYTRTNISGTEWKTSVSYPPDSVTGQQNQADLYFQDVVVLPPQGQVYPTNLFYETKRQIFQGSDQGSPLKRVQTCYNGSVPDCTATPVTLPITQTTELTQLASGQQRQSVTFRNTAGLVTETDEYDYGNNAPGGLLRKTITQYISSGSNRPSAVTIQDGAGNQIAQTQYSYDSHLNPTTVKRWVNTTNTFLTTTNQYDNHGNLISTTDPVGNTTSFSYADNFSDGVDRNSQAYLTQTTFPDTGSPTLVHHITSSKYDANTGRKVSSTDQNGNETDSTYDLLLRPLTVTLPADASGNHPKTTLSYPDPNTITVQRTITSSLNDTETGKLDGLGRTIQIQHPVPGGTAKVDATYDSMGRLFTVSNPYFSTNDSTYGIRQTQYDALGRVTRTTKQDGSVSSASYTGNCTTTTDEAGNQRTACSDALGRLIEVDEPLPGDPGVNATGSLTISGTLGSKSGVGAQPALSATGSVAISGSDPGVWTPPVTTGGCDDNGICMPVDTTPGYWTYDTGTVHITVNGREYDYSFGNGGNSADSPASVAQGLVNAIQADGARTVNASISSTSSAIVVLIAVNPGSAGNNVTVAAGSTSDFSAGTSGLALTGGQNSFAGNTVYDAGTVTVSVSGVTFSVPYGQASNATAAQVAAALASTGLNGSGSPVSATPSGASIALTYKTAGSNGNVAVTVSSNTSQSGSFSGPSFTSAGTILAGGVNPVRFLGPPVTNSSFVTLYSYDALGNLLNVTQKGDPAVSPSSQWRVRNFTYDSLSRLLAAQNPESGTISYTYDADGNLLQKTSPKANQTGSATQTISYCYDSLNRVTGKAYSAQTCTKGQLPAGTAVVSYTYDSGTNGIGRMTSLSDQAGSGSYSYDVFGRMTTEQRTIAGVSKTVSYDYNLDGSLKVLHYPSGAAVTYTPDAAGRMLSAIDSGNGINYATGGTYGPNGDLISFISGNSGSFAGITNSFSYNKRLQPVFMSASAPSQTVFSIGYDFHLGAGDNGNVFAITNNRDSTRNQSFTYDALNRLTSAQNTGTDCTKNTMNGKTEYWGNNYGYDAWGNLLSKSVTKCSAENLNATALANNQLSGYGYDAAGNMTKDNLGQSYNFDAENRITSAAGFTYTYDDEGNRVEKSNGTTGTLYWYMAPGVVAESDLVGNLQSEYVFFAGKRVARRDLPSGAVAYYFSDLLKTASVITDSSGTIKSESDYYPWGGELQVLSNDSNHYKFTGHERDGESGLDYFGARYYSNSLGRFLTPDWAAKAAAVPYAELADPQSLNLYSYVRNRPTVFVDPDGHLLLGANGQEREAAYLQAIPCGKWDAFCLELAGNKPSGEYRDINGGYALLNGAYAITKDLGTFYEKDKDGNVIGSVAVSIVARFDAETGQFLGAELIRAISTFKDDSFSGMHMATTFATTTQEIGYAGAVRAFGAGTIFDAAAHAAASNKCFVCKDLWEHKWTVGGHTAAAVGFATCLFGEPCGAIVAGAAIAEGIFAAGQAATEKK